MRYYSSLIVFALLVLVFNWSVAQEDDGLTSPTPTIAPSKTPMPAGSEAETTEVVTTESADSTTNVDFMEPFTQSDLNVLTGNVQRPNGVVWHNDKLYAVCNGDWTLYELQDTSGDTRTFIYGIRNSHALYAETISDTNFTLWIPDFDTNALMRVNVGQSPQTVVSNLAGPWGISPFDSNHFVVTNLSGNSISLIDRDGTSQELMSDLRSPTGIVVQDDFVYVANNGSSRRSIEWISKGDLLSGNSTTQPLVSGLQNTTGLVIAADGYLYFSYALGTRGVVGRVNPEVCMEEGGCTNDQIEVVLYTDLAAPLAGLTISDDMRLFVHTIFRPEIYWIQLPEKSL